MSATENATLMISSGDGPGECRQAVARLAAYLADQAGQRGLTVDLAEHPAPHGPRSVLLALAGPGASALATDWEGVVLWRCKSLLRPGHGRKNWFIQVFRLPNSTHAPASISLDDIEMQAIRAGGPGGQHQNKTSSAIRARWLAPSGTHYAVVVRDCRSQHQNRRIAAERLAALVALDEAGAELLRKGASRALHHALQRGGARKTFDGPDFRPV